jgi:hypothetical protein
MNPASSPEASIHNIGGAPATIHHDDSSVISITAISHRAKRKKKSPVIRPVAKSPPDFWPDSLFVYPAVLIIHAN